MHSSTTALVAILLSLATACSDSESASDDRRSVPSGDLGDGGREGGLTEAGVDPNGGRDSLPASCFAACQNTTFTCQTKSSSSTTVSEAELLGSGSGCSGTIKPSGRTGETVALKLDCGAVTVCVGGAPGTEPPASSCVQGTFSAFTFGYTEEGGGASLTVCTRN